MSHLEDSVGDNITLEKPSVKNVANSKENVEKESGDNALPTPAAVSQGEDLPAFRMTQLHIIEEEEEPTDGQLEIPECELDIDVRVGGRDHSTIHVFEHGEDCRDGWKDAVAVCYENDDVLEIMGKAVAESWQTLYLRRLGAIIANRGGRILEVGFGLGISSRIIQECDVDEHVIIEANGGVFNRLMEWSENQKRKVTPLEGFWEDIASGLEDESFDGILFSAFPLSEDMWHTHQFEFIKKHGYRLLKKGGVLTYCNITSWGEMMRRYEDVHTMFKETQLKHLQEAGFKEIEVDVMEFHPPEDYPFYQHKDIIIPTAIKEK